MNIIDAIINLCEHPIYKLNIYNGSHNRVNNAGESLEEYIKDLFAGTVGEKNMIIRNRKIDETFSYLGNQNNPPDSMLWGGDAIEVKKIETLTHTIALNSSYPKSVLTVDNPMLNKACRECESWQRKDIIYTIGTVRDGVLKSLVFVYGVDYCADKAVYEKIKDVIKDGILNISDVEFSETKELGRVNRVDPLGITSLRIRGMWMIENPLNVFDYVYKTDESKKLSFMCIINQNKYNSFNNTNKLEALCDIIKTLKITDINIKSPNNPARLRAAKLITFSL